MKHPAIDNAVQTTPPIINAASIPFEPFNPMAAMTTLARINVINVIPLTGLEPTMAMALAATVVNRNAMTVTNKMATMANNKLCITPNQKNINVMMIVAIEQIPINLKEISRCVRTWSCVALVFPFNSFEAKPTAFLMIPQLLMIPMIPAMAIPPIPMLRAYVLNISSGDICPTVDVTIEPPMLSTWSWNKMDIPGTISHHTATEPNVMNIAYFKPMM